MPTYDYKCEACHHEFELFQSITAPVKRKCPECGENRLKRLVGTGAGVLFKGSGFYETDYRSASYKKAAEAEKKSAEKPGTSKSDDGPSKPAKETSPAAEAPVPGDSAKSAKGSKSARGRGRKSRRDAG